MTKQECIQQAWGDSFDETVDENGWKKVNMHDFQFKYNTSIVGDFHSKGYQPFQTGRNSHIQVVYVRPNELKNLETNNGWIKIESEADLPENFSGIEFNVIAYPLNGYRKAWFQGGKFHYQSMDSEGNSHWFPYDNVTHYKPVKIEPLPLW